MPDVPHRDALVIRFEPIQPDLLLRHVKKINKRYGAHRASVFADITREDETHDELVTRLLEVAQLEGIVAANNHVYWCCEPASLLIDDGFHFVKDRYDGEEDEHYSIDLGDSPSIEDTSKLAAHFEPREWAK